MILRDVLPKNLVRNRFGVWLLFFLFDTAAKSEDHLDGCRQRPNILIKLPFVEVSGGLQLFLNLNVFEFLFNRTLPRPGPRGLVGGLETTTINAELLYLGR